MYTQLGASDSPAHELQAHQQQAADLARCCSDYTKWQIDNSSSQRRAEACNREGTTARKDGQMAEERDEEQQQLVLQPEQQHQVGQQQTEQETEQQQQQHAEEESTGSSDEEEGALTVMEETRLQDTVQADQEVMQWVEELTCKFGLEWAMAWLAEQQPASRGSADQEVQQQ